MLSNFLQQAKNKISELKTEALKYKSKDFLNASLAGSALIAMADGHIDTQEKLKMIAFLESNDALSIYDTSEVLKTWKEYIEVLEMDTDIGTAKLMSAIGKMKGKEEQSRLILRMICAIAASDGDFDDDEKKVARKIAIELGLNAEEFDI